ncbi:27405_t:CDS:1, partial [Dentiscutata erythropus]
SISKNKQPQGQTYSFILQQKSNSPLSNQPTSHPKQNPSFD